MVNGDLPRDCIQIWLLTGQNGATGQDEPTTLLKGTKAEEEEELESITE